MSRFIAGILGTLLLLGAGLLWWQGRAQDEKPVTGPPPPLEAVSTGLPDAGDIGDARGPAPPVPPEAPKLSREEVRFNRYDRDRDELISRNELMGSRTAAFRKLDTDGNNLLTFEEWAVATGERFKGADADRNGLLTRQEFATTAPKRKAKVRCRC
ncbi:hypothetical protein [Novosphingopyxis sp. YJ-S2-01]|uniref:hypothetical protein n=1 Tax=Novosphingopyxis sp. YJ-S2-01 TaxID=2794021 RepID=UPI0018DBFE7E|nr:hypothetical protein [Novosphingopyxis sp. YJ-S2-01]MBH9537961.1 hypothetical protein [Novosphingopyxis sp. YJ-S2-01]